MIKVNFKAYSTYLTESLHQWDLNQTLEVTGLNLDSAPEVHFSNSNSDRAIVRQASLKNQVITVGIPNSLLQEPHRIFAHIGVYEGDTFKVVEVAEIPVKPRKRPADYQLTDKDDEVYSFKRLENMLANRATTAQVANIIAHNNDTDGNSELVDVRYGANGVTYSSAGEAMRGQLADMAELPTLQPVNVPFVVGTLYSGAHNNNYYRIHTERPVRFDDDTVLTIAGGYRFAVHTMATDDETVFISDSGWITSDFFVPKGVPVGIIIAQNPEATERADIALYKSKLRHKTSVAMQTDIDAEVTAPLNISGSYKRGTLNNGIFAGHQHRVVTEELQHDANRDTVITAKEGFRFVVAYYGHEGNYYNDTDWMTGTYTIPAGSYWRLIIGKTPEASTIANITEYGRAVIVSKTAAVLMSDISHHLRRAAPNFGEDAMCRAINHRGYNTVAPENTLPAFAMSKKQGFNIVEADIRFTSDGYAVLLHDETVDRTSDGSGNIASMTFAAARALDFGSWKSAEYVGTQIPTFEDFLTLCKRLSLHAYCEIETGSESNIKSLVNSVKKLGMERNVTWCSFEPALLAHVRKYAPSARLLLNVNAAYWGGLYLNVLSLRTPFNEVGLNYQYDLIDSTLLEAVRTNDIPLEVWTVNDEADLLNVPAQVSGITSDTLNCTKVFLDEYGIE